MDPARSIRVIQAIVGFAACSGVSPPALLSAAGLDPAQLAGADTDLPLSKEMHLWDEAARLTGDQDFGLHLAQWVASSPEEHFDVLTFALRSCATLGDHYRRVGRYIRLIHDGLYVALEEEQDLARLVHGANDGTAWPRHPNECHLAMALLHGRRTTGEAFAPRAICFTHAPPERLSEHERIFGVTPRFLCPRIEMVLDRALLDLPQRHAEPRLLALLDRQLTGALTALPAERTFREAVRRAMKEQLPDQEPVMTTVAALLHMSPRSLQRRLHSEGTRFAEVLAELRRDLALRYLQEPRIAISEVAFLLGFCDVSAFYRAFKRWTGTTPADFKRAASTHPS